MSTISIISGRVLRVMMQADAPFRIRTPMHCGTSTCPVRRLQAAVPRTMIPLSSVVNTQWTMAAPSLTRYNGYAAVDIIGGQAPGKSTGEAMD